MNLSPLAGAKYLLYGFQLIFQPGVRRYVAIPLLINTVLFSTLIWFGASRFDQFIEWLLPDWLNWLEGLIWPLFAVSVLIIVFFTFSLLANLIGAPFNGFLAEAVEHHLTGKKPDPEGGPKELIAGVMRSLSSEFNKILYFLFRSIPLLILFFIPLINIVAPYIWMAFNAWMLSLEYLDYPMGNHGLIHTQQHKIIQEKRLLALGFGGATMVLLMIPFLNFIGMPTAVAGATALWVKEFSGLHSTV